MKSVGIFFNTDKPKARAEMLTLKKWLEQRGCRVHVLPSDIRKMPALDLAVTLGGDGTMLKASRSLAPLSIPVLGVNLGSLGFLAETDPAEAYEFLERVLAGSARTEERMMLSVSIDSPRRKTVTALALNDCIIHSGNNGRVIAINARINGEYFADYVGDGLIVATPTGSTAYSLAASGPIVHPHLSVFILTPICPHTLAQRPMIISTDHVLTLQAEAKAMRQKPILSLDGQDSYLLGGSDTVTISLSPHPLLIVKNPERKYFKVLRTKLRWGERG